MAINKNHEFEELNGIKCSIVEKNVSKERAAFLKELLEHNKFEVVIAPSPPSKAAVAANPVAPAEGGPQTSTVGSDTPPPETFTVGVTNLAFNTVNALFGRLLRTKDGHIVTVAYWQQKEAISNDNVPYFQ